jgi:hypothetical protein
LRWDALKMSLTSPGPKMREVRLAYVSCINI